MPDPLSPQEQSDISFLAHQYQPVCRIGEGAYSFVCKAKNKKVNQYVAIKVITRTSAPTRVIDELKFIKATGGINNVIELLSVHRHKDQICAVFPYFEATDFRTFLSDCTIQEIRNYLFNLLVALKQIHKFKIIHRDIKPTNFLYNRNEKKGVLIDFGLAQYEKFYKRREGILDEKTNSYENGIDGSKNALYGRKNFILQNCGIKQQPPGYFGVDSRLPLKAPRCGTRGFRAPEILFRSQRQTTAVDMWATGVVFLILLTKQYPFFCSADDLDAIAEIGTIFGHAGLRKAAKLNLRTWKSNLETIPENGISLEKVVSTLNPECKLRAEGYDLLYRLLDLDCETRITADEALKHPFFIDLCN